MGDGWGDGSLSGQGEPSAMLQSHPAIWTNSRFLVVFFQRTMRISNQMENTKSIEYYYEYGKFENNIIPYLRFLLFSCL